MPDEATPQEPADAGCTDDSKAVQDADNSSTNDAAPEYDEIDLTKGGAA